MAFLGPTKITHFSDYLKQASSDLSVLFWVAEKTHTLGGIHADTLRDYSLVTTIPCRSMLQGQLQDALVCEGIGPSIIPLKFLFINFILS